jgi:hypothetical protein
MSQYQYPPISRHEDFFELFNPTNSLKLEMVGDWKKLPALFRYLGGGSFNQGVKRDIAKAVRNYLERYKRNLINGILSEGRAVGQPWEPHTKMYQRRFAKHPIGLLDRVYLGALENLQITQSSYILSLSFARGDLNRKSRGGYILGQYSVIFENGYEVQPARPLWSATFQFMGGEQKVLKDIYGAVGKRLKTLT